MILNRRTARPPRVRAFIHRSIAVCAVAALLVLGLQTTASATLNVLTPDPTTPATFVGHGGYSTDGLGQNQVGGTVQAQVPAGSTVVKAYLYGTYNGSDLNLAVEQRTLDFDGTTVVLGTLANSEVGNSGLITARAEITAQVAAKVGTGGGITDFAVNSDPPSLDGVALVVIYANPASPLVTVAVLDGGSKQAGDTVTLNFASPLNTSTPGFAAVLSLGSGFSYQGIAGHDCGGGQFSTVDVNGSRLTSCAGNYDDGLGEDGALITVGGVGDSLDNPADPTTQGGTDDELYNLTPFVHNGDSSLVLQTANPSGDDNLFLAVVSITAMATVTTEICNNGLDDDGDGLIDKADPDCNQPPVADGQTVTTTQDTAKAITLTGSDPDGDTISYTATNPTHGTLSGTAPNLTYTPDTGYSGPDSFTFTTNDGKATSPPATVTITVTPVTPPSQCASPAPQVDKVVWADYGHPQRRLVSPKLSTSQGGALILAFVAADGPRHATQRAVSVWGGGLTWTLARRSNTTWGTTEVWQAYAKSRLTGAVITAKLANPGYDGSITVAAFTGAAAKVGATAAAAGLKGAPTATVKPTRCDSLIWAAGHDWTSAKRPVPVAGQSIVHSFIDRRVCDSFWTQRVNTPTGVLTTPVTVRATGPVKDRWTMAAVEIPAA
jgi:hypothetical protein